MNGSHTRFELCSLIIGFHDFHTVFFIYMKVQFSKRYANFAEDARRMNIYMKNKNTIDVHNKLFWSGRSTYEMGLNMYSDLSHEEFVAQMNGLRRPDNEE